MPDSRNGTKKEDKAYPRSVRQMLTKRSAPQPAIIHTPTGGTVGRIRYYAQSPISRRLALVGLTEDGYDDDQKRANGVCACHFVWAFERESRILLLLRCKVLRGLPYCRC